jgi:hypothetical protein
VISKTRTIGVVTGGGDCPGLNAVIRAVVRTVKLQHGWRVIGITNGLEIRSVPLVDAIGSCKLVDPGRDYVRAARAVGITFGDRA